ncbi:cupin domain-containing protein [Nitrincola tapanii]|uniref:Cupin domain-containing protein n=1 Tax=Nitrincola tapanii TaxID=1708751 RepID=A0A5A9W4E5_9GAMM|nr:cupin domain-containing protein [Nitrincola tapanii]KAA0875383.1 cupin domain-containing protein [Nitrincola tapanii]
MSAPHSLPLGDMPLETFLSDYWQKRPLLIRQAIPGIQPPIEADELAGLACEEGVESRLIQWQRDQDLWKMEHGPFPESRFSELPSRDWTLLVQAVDQQSPEAHALLRQFDFIPNWRLDDLMISFAVTGGGVGPHYDNYDVFLLQVSGQRQWEIGPLCNEHSPRRQDAPVMILPEWHPEETYVLEPGDLLYLPPGVSHNGISLSDDCMTCSIGFRAPSHQEMLRSFSDYIGEHLGHDLRYSDPDLSTQTHPGEIQAAALDKIQQLLLDCLKDRRALERWFGQWITEAKYEPAPLEGEESSVEELRAFLQEGGRLQSSERSRFAYICQDNAQWLFCCEGESHLTGPELHTLVQHLCRYTALDAETPGALTDTGLELLSTLINQGVVYALED